MWLAMSQKLLAGHCKELRDCFELRKASWTW